MCSAATVAVCAVLGLHVINQADVPDQTMTRVKNRVERYFHNAGIALDWDAGHDARLTIVLATKTRMREIDPEQRGVLGLAVTGSRRAYIFIDRVEAHALEVFRRSATPRIDRPDMVNRTASETTLIALVMAHEIGHLMLPPGSHSPRGLMSKNITLDGFRRAIDQALFFSPDESRAMRAALPLESSAAPRAR